MTGVDQSSSISELIDLKAGTLSREIFVNEQIYRQEQEQIFARSWLFVGHESQIPNPGDYFVSRMGEESVILTRDKGGEVHVFLNSCRHRGMKVCRYDEGNTAIFTCPYHGWGFATDGKLVGVPFYEEAYHKQLDKSQWGLIEVAQLENYKGTIWATWDKATPPFIDYLGEMKVMLDQALDCRDGREGGSEVLGGVQKWIVPSNWKFAAENFVGDLYHNISHQSVDMVGIAPGGKGRRDDERVVRMSASYPRQGHGGLYYWQEKDTPYTPAFHDNPSLDEYFKHCYEERQRRLGEKSRVLGGVGTVFPNMSLHARQPRAIVVWHPAGPLHMESWRFYLVDKDAPEEAKEYLRHYYMRYSGPAGLTEQDDMENWNYATSASKGTIARRYPYNYEMGIGFEGPHELIPGLVTQGNSEQNQRGFYKRWAEFMEARSWDDLV
jgi:phenylpropionate dioxygenase-like ring-hydroxylating dioxygenase large terminal subunit